jgi:hypothetical protein
MREELVEFLKPDKRRVAIAVLLPCLWVGVRLAISFLSSKIWGGRFIAPVLHLSPVSAAISILAGLLESLLYYPFACALVLALDYHRKGELGRLLGNRRLLGLEIAGLVLFNPPVMGALLLLAMIGIYALMAPQYGLEVIEVYPDSPTIGFGSLREGSTLENVLINVSPPVLLRIDNGPINFLNWSSNLEIIMAPGEEWGENSVRNGT